MNFLTDYSIGLISPIALLQLCALPGLILSLKLQIKQNILIYISLVFVNSLVINHILVLVLTTLKIFIHPLVIILATFEIVFIFIKIDTVYQSINLGKSQKIKLG